jgi:hypothetical protein
MSSKDKPTVELRPPPISMPMLPLAVKAPCPNCGTVVTSQDHLVKFPCDKDIPFHFYMRCEACHPGGHRFTVLVRIKVEAEVESE